MRDTFKPGHAWLARHRPALPSTEGLALALVQDLRDERKIDLWLGSLRRAVDAELTRAAEQAGRDRE